jgi:hypothetical protein
MLLYDTPPSTKIAVVHPLLKKYGPFPPQSNLTGRAGDEQQRKKVG